MKVPYKRSGLRTYLILIGAIANSATPLWIIAGLPFFIAGMIIRIWAKGCLHQNREITRSGPYAFVRHPFYMGNLMLDFGIVIMSGFIPLMIIFPFLWFGIYIPTMKREEKALIGLFGDDYKEYQRSLPLLFPYKKAFIENRGFSWNNPNIYRTEIPRTIRFLSYPFIFYLIYLLRVQGLYALYSSEAIITCALIATFYIISWELKSHFAYSKDIIPFSISTNKRGLLLLGIIAMGFFIHWAEVEYDHLLWPLGITLLGISIFVKNPIKAEWVMTAGLSILFELIWLALVISPVYLALFLDKRSVLVKENRRYLHLFILITGLLLALSKEINYN